jgi:Fe-S-cluster containining protein
MQYVPWRYISDWRCISCGDCCRLYTVVITFREWLEIVRNYGVGNTSSDLNKLSIARKSDGSCVFLNNSLNVCGCGLQQMKPKACQLWPFKILSEPRFGYPREASYLVPAGEVFIYADPMCNGLRFGVPTLEFAGSVLKEFVEIAAGLRSSQLKTTSNCVWPHQPHARTIFT